MTAEVAAPAQDEPVYCICRGPEHGFMVNCDGCEEWFHGDCVGLKKRQADKLDKYLCPNCAPPTDKNAKLQTPDLETSKSRSGRSIKKKKWDEEEFEYDFKNKEEDEDYEEEDEERPHKAATPKRLSTSALPQHSPHLQHLQHGQHLQHLQHPQHPQHAHHPPHLQHPQHQHSQQIPSFLNNNNNNNHYTHPNHLNLAGHGPITSHLNINPTIQAINSINHYLHAPAPLANPHPNPNILPHPIVAPTSLSGIQGASPGSKRSFNAVQGIPKPSPEPKPKVVRRESFPPGSTKG